MLSDIKLYNKSILNSLNSLDDDSINYIIYFLDYKYQDKSFSYLNTTEAICKALFKKLTDDGRISLIVNDAIGGYYPTHISIHNILTKLNYSPLSTIIWNKEVTEKLFSWGSFQSAKSPNIVHSFYYILTFFKNSKFIFNPDNSDISKEEFITYTNGGVWNIPNDNYKYPIELSTRLVKLYTYKQSLILEPNAGRSATGYAAHILNRKYIGYCPVRDEFNRLVELIGI